MGEQRSSGLYSVHTSLGKQAICAFERKEEMHGSFLFSPHVLALPLKCLLCIIAS